LLPWSIGSGEFGSHGNDPEWRGGVVDMFDHDGGDAPWLPISSLEAPSRSLLPTPIFKLSGETTNHWIGRRRRWWWRAPTWGRCLGLLFLGEFAMEGKVAGRVFRLMRLQRCGGPAVRLCILWGDRHRQVFLISRGASPSILGKGKCSPSPQHSGMVVTAHIRTFSPILFQSTFSKKIKQFS
jgi:hypothetical protein